MASDSASASTPAPEEGVDAELPTGPDADALRARERATAERYGVVSVQRLVKADGRSLLLYEHPEHGQD